MVGPATHGLDTADQIHIGPDQGEIQPPSRPDVAVTDLAAMQDDGCSQRRIGRGEGGEAGADLLGRAQRRHACHFRRAAGEEGQDGRHILCAAPAYLEKYGAPQSLEDLANHNCLRYSHYPFGNEWRFIGPDQADVSARVSGNLVTNSAETLLMGALGGEGLLLLPSFIVLQDLRSGALCRLLPDHRPVEFAINAIYPHRDHLSTKVRTFIDLLAVHFARHREWLNPFDPTAVRPEARPEGFPLHQD